ncbi:MAG TPA: AGE family epimerase/isomerase [Trueperaceae bacterium]|nr:AGE family epimerase/isomerase [Trueperaceae bacterium]
MYFTLTLPDWLMMVGMSLDHIAVPTSRNDLAEFYREHLEEVILPFWLETTLDEERGGLFNCVDNVTGKRVSDDKFVWSQARWAWTAAHAARMAERGLLDVDGDRLRRHAKLTADFLLEHAFLPAEDGTAGRGNVVYLLTASGEKREFLPGMGHDISFFADCFVTLALTGVARATGESSYLEEALGVYRSVRGRLATGSVRSEPYPLPTGARAHAWPMIMLNVAQELERALKAAADPRASILAAEALADMDSVLDDFVRPDDLVAEVLVPGEKSSLLARHVTPGHAIESMWFVMEQALAHGRHDAVAKAKTVIAASYRAGWDAVHGGLFRYVIPGQDGPRPGGTPAGPFETLITDTWDGKIWWPHSETLYATLLAAEATGDVAMRALHDQMFGYTFATFPNPDRSVGEWIHIRDRQGGPLPKVMGLPVKDPYHVTRNLLLVVELLSEGVAGRTTKA